jgi:hypothetical protein
MASAGALAGVGEALCKRARAVTNSQTVLFDRCQGLSPVRRQVRRRIEPGRRRIGLSASALEPGRVCDRGPVRRHRPACLKAHRRPLAGVCGWQCHRKRRGDGGRGRGAVQEGEGEEGGEEGGRGETCS